MSFRGVLIAGSAVAIAVVVACIAGPVSRRVDEASPTAPTPAMSDVAYAGASAAEVLDIWMPSTARRPHPLVIFVHGGGWSGGDKRDVGPKVVPLLQRGFAVASVNYRLSGEAHFPELRHGM